MNEDTHIAKMLQRFSDPPASCRTMPQWSWNEEIERDRITAVLGQFKERGCGGVFMHPRPGIMVDYLSERWFDLWDFAMREAERLGLEWHIYDEFTAAGGNAGGHVVARSPQAAAQEIRVVSAPDPIHLTGRRDIVALFRYAAEGDVVEWLPHEDLVAASDCEGETGDCFLAVIAGFSGTGTRRNGLAPADLFHPDTAGTFIRTTHERYAIRSGDGFGTTVRFVFNDEPHVNVGRNGYPYSPYIRKEFREEHGYDLEERLAALCFWEEDSPAVRYDYYTTLNRLYNDNFVRPLYDWCADHRLEFTGHFMEHEWPSPHCQPDSMASLRWMQAPGNDLLGFQFVTSSHRENGIYFLNLKELTSVASQYDRKHVMVESCGGGGYQAAFDIFKPTEDYLLAFGVNSMDPHLSHYSLVGARKYDFAQTLSDHSSWWPYYRTHADHVARVIAAMDDSREYNRVLLLHPTTTAWMYHQPAGFPWDDGPNRKVMDRIRESQIEAALSLYRSQVDFDLGDECLMAESGHVFGGKLHVGAREYGVVVFAGNMETWTESTLGLIRGLLDGGGILLHTGELPVRIDGRVDSRPAELPDRFPEQLLRFVDMDTLVHRLRELVPPYLRSPDGSPLPGELVWRRSVLPDGTRIFFCCNPWEERLTFDLRLEGGYLYELDTGAGTLSPLETSDPVDGTWRIVHVDLYPRNHLLLIASSVEIDSVHDVSSAQDSVVAVRAETGGEGSRAKTPLEVRFIGAEPAEPNLMVVDFCDLETCGRTVTDINTVVADRLNWDLQGWNASPWLMAGGIKPFNGNVFKTAVGTGGEYRVRYRFHLSADFTAEQYATCLLAIERPERYTVSLNGRIIPTTEFITWFDIRMGRAPVGSLLTAGENIVELHATRWDVVCEPAPIYLGGRFSLQPVERGFAAAPVTQLGLEDWTRSGMPFYPWKVIYKFGVPQDAPTDRFRVELGRWGGSLVSVRWNGVEVGEIFHPPYSLNFQTPSDDQSSRGSGNTTASRTAAPLELTVVGNMRNMMGPFFAEGVPVAPRWAAGADHMPPGDRYRTVPSGLFTPPRVYGYTEDGCV